jgi:putative PIN family toxin of toxin-antitoxin system
VVFDTNVLVSRVLIEASKPGLAVRKAENEARILTPRETFDEFCTVLLRAKFDHYADAARRREFLERYKRIAEIIAIQTPIRACRDPRDDKFLSLAVFGEADLIVSGDADLLVLNPFRTIKIVSPTEYLAQ